MEREQMRLIRRDEYDRITSGEHPTESWQEEAGEWLPARGLSVRPGEENAHLLNVPHPEPVRDQRARYR